MSEALSLEPAARLEYDMIIMYGELEGMRKEAVMVCFKAFYYHIIPLNGLRKTTKYPKEKKRSLILEVIKSFFGAINVVIKYVISILNQ
jgi:hypothetical protein